MYDAMLTLVRELRWLNSEPKHKWLEEYYDNTEKKAETGSRGHIICVTYKSLNRCFD